MLGRSRRSGSSLIHGSQCLPRRRSGSDSSTAWMDFPYSRMQWVRGTCMRKLPTAPWTDAQQHQLEEVRGLKEIAQVLGKKRLNVANLQVMLLSDGKRVQPLCAHARKGQSR